MSRCMLATLVRSLPAIALDLAGIWKQGGQLAAALFALALVLAMPGINASDRNFR